ncbi:MAG: DUF6318 family protein [Nocardioidaceae bacterium]
MTHTRARRRSGRRTGRHSAGRLALASACLTGVVAVAGCNSNPEPAPLATPSEGLSESPSPSPSVAVPPTMPPQAKGTSAASAKAFVRYWVETLNYAGPSGDTDQLDLLSDGSCAACTAIIKFIDGVHADGGSIDGKGWTIKQVKVVAFAPTRMTMVDALVDVQPQSVQRTGGVEPTHFGGGTRLKGFWLVKAGEDWSVSRLEQPE